jgi:hypothetical protein
MVIAKLPEKVLEITEKTWLVPVGLWLSLLEAAGVFLQRGQLLVSRLPFFALWQVMDQQNLVFLLLGPSQLLDVVTLFKINICCV